jgi:hypothetical protein
MDSKIDDYAKYSFFRWESLYELIKFSSLYSIFFIIGAMAAGNKRLGAKFPKLIISLGGKIRLSHIIVGAGATVAAFLVFVGGPGEILHSSVSRLGKMNEASLLNQIIISLSRMLGAVVMVLSSLKFASSKEIYVKAICLICIFIASAQNFYTFSRWAGVGFIVCGGIYLLSEGRGKVIFSVVLISVGVYLNSVGFNFRNDFDIGLATFISAAWDLAYNPSKLNLDGFNINFLDYSMVGAEKITLGLSVSRAEAVKIFFVNISPLPSFLIPIRDVGWNIATEKGWNFGITTSTVVDVYLACSWFGLIVAMVHGYLLSMLYSASLRAGPWGGALLYMLALSSTVISLHGSARATSRIFWYSLVLVFVLNSLRVVGKRRGARLGQIRLAPFKGEGHDGP